jgi:hypothetical protein
LISIQAVALIPLTLGFVALGGHGEVAIGHPLGLVGASMMVDSNVNTMGAPFALPASATIGNTTIKQTQ